ncbi:MAG: carboxypeptidase-like regulatory domain-containing protein, partial [Planctomycetota bacterium]
RALGLVAFLAFAGALLYWALDTRPAELPALPTDSPASATDQPADAPTNATGGTTPETSTSGQPTRTTVTSPGANASGPAIVGKVVDEDGAPVAKAIVSTGLSTIASPRSFNSADFDMDDATRMADRMRERLARRVAVETNADGTFRLVPDGEGAQVEVEAKARAFQPESRNVDRPKGADVELGTLVLKRGAVISGRVSDNQNQPVAGASVIRIQNRAAQPPGAPALPGAGGANPFGMFGGGAGGPDFMPGEMADVMRGLMGDVLTDADGRFEMQNAPAGAFSLRVRHNEHPAEVRDGLAVEKGQTLADVLIVLAPGADIRGSVTAIPEGTKEVRVLAAPATIANFGGNEGNDPFGGMGAQIMEMASDFALTAERSAEVQSDGTFHLRGLPIGQRFRVWVTQGPRGFLNNKVCSQRAEVASGASGVELVYDPGITVTATITDQKTGSPVESMIVRHQFDGGNDMAAMVQGFMGRGGQMKKYPGGALSIGDLRPKKEQKLRLTIDALGYRRFEQRDIVLPASGTLELGTIQLEPVPVVNVLVTSKVTGQPLEGATVRLQKTTPGGGGGGDMNSRIEAFMNQGGGRRGGNNPFGAMAGQNIGTQTTDRLGVATLNAITDGAFAVVVEHDDHAPYRSGELQPPTAPIDHAVTLVAGGQALVTALDGDGNPIKNARIETQPAGAGGESDFQNANGEGAATFAHLVPGVHKFRLATAGAGGGIFGGGRRRGGAAEASTESPWLEAEIQDGATVELTLSKAQSATLTGLVTENGAPVADARVQFVKGAQDEASSGDPVADMMRGMRGMGGGTGGRTQRTDQEGRYTLKELEAGQHRVRVSVSGRSMPVTMPVFLRLGENTFDVQLDSASLAGVVLDPEGKPVADASVRVVVAGDTSLSLESMMQGMSFGGARNGRGMFGGGGSTDVKTDEQGRFQLPGVSPQTALVVRAQKAGFAGSESAPVEVASGSTKNDIEVRLLQGGKVNVTTATSTPFAAVIATYEGQDVKGVQPVIGILGNGKATLDGLRPGQWRIAIRTGMGGIGGQGVQGGGANAGSNPGQVVTISAGQTVDVTL